MNLRDSLASTFEMTSDATRRTFSCEPTPLRPVTLEPFQAYLEPEAMKEAKAAPRFGFP